MNESLFLLSAITFINEKTDARMNERTSNTRLHKIFEVMLNVMHVTLSSIKYFYLKSV